jgi:cobalamin-dependent methionine synthase I
MFWLPAGWVPYYVEWILSFPRAPLGSISIQVWTAACAAIIALASEAFAAVWVLATKKPTPAAKQQEKEAMAFKADQKQKSASGADERKEL